MRRLFRDINLVTAPSRTLAERLFDLGAPRIDVIENFVAKDSLRPPHRPGDTTTIGWVAGLEHQIDLDAIPIKQVLQRLLDERPDVRVTTIGLGLGLHSERYTHIPLVEIAQVTRHASAFDIAIAPLSDIPLNQSRSNVKVKEYAAAGVPWLASPIGPYAAMGEKQGGRLVSDDRWFEDLSSLIDKKRDRWKLAKRAAKWAEDDTVERNVGVWEARLGAAIAHAEAKAAPALSA